MHKEEIPLHFMYSIKMEQGLVNSLQTRSSSK